MILKLRAALDCPTSPVNPMSIPSSRGMISRDSCFQPDTRNSFGTPGHVFEGLPAPGEPSSEILEYSKNLASSSCRLKQIDTSKIAEREVVLGKEFRKFTIPTPRCAGNFATWKRLYRTWANLFSKLYDGKPEESYLGLAFRQIPWHIGLPVLEDIFRAWNIFLFSCLAIAMLWIKEVEASKSVDDLMTSQSIKERVFTGIEMLDAKMASALKRIKTMVRRHIDQMIKTLNFRARNERIETGVLVKSQEGKTVFKRVLLQFQPRILSWTTCTIVLSCSTSADTDLLEEKPSKGTGPRGESPSLKERL